MARADIGGIYQSVEERIIAQADVWEPPKMPMTEFRMTEHKVLSDRPVIELWQGGRFIGELTPTPRGFRLLSKYPVEFVEEAHGDVNIVRVEIGE